VPPDSRATRVVGRLLAWGSPTTWELTADIEQYVASAETKSEAAYELRADHVIEFAVSDVEGTRTIGFGTTFSKETFELVLGENNDYLTLKKKVVAPGKVTYQYEVKRPAGT
jgi:hypothetical protein